MQAELEDLCFAVLHPHEYTVLRNELNAMWGLQHVTDLIPAQAETLLSQAAASVRTAADIAASSDLPHPQLPTPGPVPRPNLLGSPDQEANSQGPSRDSMQQSMQSVQTTAGDLYASVERGMVRTPGHARISSRHQKALRSGLLRLSPRVRQTPYGSAAAVLEPPRTLPPPPAPPTSSATSLRSRTPDNRSQAAQSATAQIPKSDDLSLEDSNSAKARPSASALRGAALHSPESASVDSQAGGNSPADAAAARGAGWGKPEPPAQGFQKVIRGRLPRRALAAEMAAKAERQGSGVKAGPSGRVTPDFSSLSSDQQRVSLRQATRVQLHITTRSYNSLTLQH